MLRTIRVDDDDSSTASSIGVDVKEIELSDDMRSKSMSPRNPSTSSIEDIFNPVSSRPTSASISSHSLTWDDPRESEMANN
jgi:hypothetical protein